MLDVFPLAYFALVLGVGLLHRPRAAGQEEFFLARRSAGTVLMTGSLLATMLGAFAVMGVSGLAFQSGLAAGWYLWGGCVGLLALALWVVPRANVSGVYTLPELLGRGYGPLVRQIAAALIAISWISLIAAQFIAAGKVLQFIGRQTAWGGLPEWGNAPFTVVITIVIIAYACLGGQRSVLRTDLIQAGFICVALLALAVGAGAARPVPEIDLPPDLWRLPFNETIGPLKALSLVLTFGVPFLVGPDIYSRLFCGRDAASARRAVVASAVLLAPLALLIVWNGVLARVCLPPSPAEANIVILELARQSLSPLWGGLLVAGLLAAVMSSADTCLLTVSTLVSRDLLDEWLGPLRDERASVRRARGIVAMAGFAALLVALYKQDIVAALMNCYKVYSPAVLCPFLALVLFRGRRFSSWTGAVAVLSGGLCAAIGLWLQLAALQVAAFAVAAIPIVFDLLLSRRRQAPNPSRF